MLSNICENFEIISCEMSEIWLFEISIFQIMSDYAMIYPYVKTWKYFFMIEKMILHILV